MTTVALHNLAVAAYASTGWTLWHYRAEYLADTMEAGYWAAATMLKQGDHIAVSAPDGGATLYVGTCGVTPMAVVR